MIKFVGEKPVVLEILLIIASFLLSLVFMIPFPGNNRLADGTGRRNGTYHCGCHSIPCFYQGV